MPELSDWPKKVWLFTKVTVEVEPIELDAKTVTEAQEELVYVVTREPRVFAQARGERDLFEGLCSQLRNKFSDLPNQRVFRHVSATFPDPAQYAVEIVALIQGFTKEFQVFWR